MEKARAAVSNFISKDGKHDTTVHEHVKPAVQQERVTPTRHENITTAIDKEVHQDHYHTSVQPIHDKEVLPEKHSHNLAGTTHREFHHGNSDSIKQRHAAEGAAIKSTRDVGETQHTQAEAGTVKGEHVHHHVHESVQPVIQKETIQPQVVHTTVPVHEVHHKEAQRHAASTLPAVSMSEFKNAGGSLTGQGERHDAFQGHPRELSSTGHPHIGGNGAQGTTHLTSHGHNSNTHAAGAVQGSGRTTDGPHNSNLANKADPRVDSDRDGRAAVGTGIGSQNPTHSSTGVGSHSTSNPTHSSTGLGSHTTNNPTHSSTGLGSHSTNNPIHSSGTNKTDTRLGSGGAIGTGVGTGGAVGSGIGSHSTNSPTHTTSTTTTTTSHPQKKAGLMDKLNPMVDADGDGKAGFMK